MGLVEDERVVAQQSPVALDLGEQDAVGHQLHQGAVTGLIGEPHGVADGLTQRRAQLVGDALADRARGEAARLGVADRAADTATEFQADLGQLRRLAGARLAGDDDDLMIADRLGDLVAALADRQIGIGDRRNGGQAGGDQPFGRGDLLGDLSKLVGPGAAKVLQATAEAGRVADRQAVEALAKLRD